METKEYLSSIIKKGLTDRESTAGINIAVKVFAFSVLALFAYGAFTTSQRLNAG